MEKKHLDSDLSIPLVIDLDGTLLLTDTLHESIIIFLKKNPFLNFFLLLLWLIKGKARFKELISDQVKLNVETLPYNETFLNFIKKEREKGRKLILCTAANKRIANDIAKYLNIFDEVYSSTGVLNLSGESKFTTLKGRFGEKGFIYAGNSHDDIAVWRHSKEQVVVNASKSTLKKLQKIEKTFINFVKKNISLRSLIKLFRIHQWSKNVLIFFPLIAAPQFFNFENMGMLVLAFFVFGICASSTYIINDILDIENDRLHKTKKFRPFAAGTIPAIFSLSALIILPISIFFAGFISINFMLLIMMYILITLSYSIYLKTLPIIDCLVLASLYTIRIVGGALVISSTLSFWLLGFSLMFFFSLSLLKRYAEIPFSDKPNQEILFGRGYEIRDYPLILNMGVSSGYGSIIIMMLYLNNPEIMQLHNYNKFAWLTIPVLLFWVSYVWLQAHRDNMHDDPVIFALKDFKSILSGIAFFAFMLIGSQ